MNDNAPVPYPSGGFAYPVAKPVVAYAPPIAAPVVEPVVEPLAEIRVEAVVAPASEPIVEAAPAAENVQPPKFFPLVPTQTSKFVSQPENLVVEPETLPAEPVEPLESPFDISSSLTREPQTNSIVLDEIPDALTISDIVTDAGQILATGSIELPTLTGEVTVVSDSPEADQADLIDSASVTISTIAPVRAPSVINSKAQLGVLPSKRRKNQGQLMAMLTLAIMIVTVGTLYAMAAILGFIK